MPEENTIVETPVEPAAEAEAAPPPPPESAEAAESKRLAAENLQLTAEKSELQDLLLRRQADYDNFRRRTEREKAEMREFAAMSAVESLLPILDDFERALRSGNAEAEAFRDYAKGMELIHQRLVETLAKLGLEPVASVGTPFDPNVHNAIQREDRGDVPDQIVLEEYQRGYNFRGRPLRAAMVKVAVNP